MWLGLLKGLGNSLLTKYGLPSIDWDKGGEGEGEGKGWGDWGKDLGKSYLNRTNLPSSIWGGVSGNDGMSSPYMRHMSRGKKPLASSSNMYSSSSFPDASSTYEDYLRRDRERNAGQFTFLR